MKLNADSLPRHLEGQLLPVYLVSGDEPLIAGEAADAVRACARERGFTEREVLHMDRGADWDAARAAVGTLSLFAARRLIEVRLPTGKPGVGGGRALTAIAAGLTPDTLLLILTGRLDREAQGAEWVRAVEARGAWVAVWPIAAERMVPWLEGRCRRLGLVADRDALEVLADRTQGNLLAAQQELEKLKLLHGSERITAARILAGSSDSARFNVGELTEALVAGNPGRALRILAGLRAEGGEPPLVLWATVRAMHELWTRAAGSEAGSRGRGSRPSFARLTARAVRVDALAKGRTRGDPWDELALLACELCGKAPLPMSAARLE
ncbi:MAG TPA: DNA polymerase III subunit delta [Steroidobacteraceae bacterium]|nr:DNA polymerase III subunit delta [Steroidobacteraceae bacterium]